LTVLDLIKGLLISILTIDDPGFGLKSSSSSEESLMSGMMSKAVHLRF